MNAKSTKPTVRPAMIPSALQRIGGRKKDVVPLFDSTRLTVVSHSPTRRIVLEKIFRHYFKVTGISFSNIDSLNGLASSADLLLIDKHNTTPATAGIFEEILNQTLLPLLIINSSDIPAESADRKLWSAAISEHLIAIYLDFHQVNMDAQEEPPGEIIDFAIDQQTETTPDLASIVEDVGSEAEKNRLDAILKNLPMQKYHEISNDRPMLTAEEINFDYFEKVAEFTDDKPISQNNVESMQQRNRLDFTDYDSIFSDPDRSLGPSSNKLGGTLKSWFASFFSKILHRPRKRA